MIIRRISVLLMSPRSCFISSLLIACDLIVQPLQYAHAASVAPVAAENGMVVTA